MYSEGRNLDDIYIWVGFGIILHHRTLIHNFKRYPYMGYSIRPNALQANRCHSCVELPQKYSIARCPGLSVIHLFETETGRPNQWFGG